MPNQNHLAEHYLRKELYTLVMRDTQVFDFIQDGSLDGIWYWDLEHPEHEWMSARFWTTLGYDPAQMQHLAAEWQDLIDPNDLQVSLDNFRRHCEDPLHPYDQVVRYRHKEGHTVWIRCRGIAIRDASGRPIRMLGAHTDLTPGKRIEEALEQSEARYRELVDSLPEGVIEADLNARITYANEQGLAMMGYSNEDLQAGIDAFDIIAPSDRARARKNLAQRLRGEDLGLIQYNAIRKDGSTIPVLLSIRIIGGTESPRGFLAIVLDHSERLKAEESRARTQERFQLIDDASLDFIYSYDRESRFTHANRSLCQALQLPAGQILGKTHAELGFPEVQCREWDELHAKVYATNTTVTAETSSPMPSGEVRHYEVVLNPLHNGDGTIIGIAGTTRDITEQKRILGALRKSEETYRRLLNTLSAGVMVHSPDTSVQIANASACSLLGIPREELLGRAASDPGWHFLREDGTVMPVHDYPVNRVLLEREPVRSLVLGIRRAHPEDTVWLLVNGVPVLQEGGGIEQVLITFVDITARRRAEVRMTGAFEGVVLALSRVTQGRDPYTSGHQQRVAQLAVAIAQGLDLPTEIQDGIRVASLLHDIGKITIPMEILSKPGAPSPIEWEMIRGHVSQGASFLDGIDLPWRIREIIMQHHERLDGSGYPEGLRGEQIRLEARIIAVADVVEAMSSHRPYRPALGIESALDVLRKGRGTEFDPDVVDVCIHVFDVDGFVFSGAWAD